MANETRRSEWKNTGGNGHASAVWVRRTAGGYAEIFVRKTHCLLDLSLKGGKTELGQSFEHLEEAQAHADKALTTGEGV